MAQQQDKTNLNVVDAANSQEEGASFDAHLTTRISDLTLERNKAINAAAAAKSITDIQIGTSSAKKANPTVIKRKGLATLNEECIRRIFHYLNIMDAIRFSATCKNLCNYAKAFILPIAARQIRIERCYDYIKYDEYFPRRTYKGTHHKIKTPLNTDIQLAEKSLLPLFSLIGDFVEDLEFECNIRDNESWEYIRLLMFCQNLKKVKFTYHSFDPYQTHQVQYRIQRLPKLKELIFEYTSGIMNQWLATEGISTVVKLT